MLRTCLTCVLAALLAGCAGLPHSGSREPALDRDQKVSRSIGASVQLFAEREGARRAGSGVMVASPSGEPPLVLTAAHLLTPPLDGTVYAVDPVSGERLPAEILARDETIDAAVLAVPGLAAGTVPLQGEARLGDPVWVVSFPWGRRGTFATGVVSQIDGEGPGIPVAGSVSLIDAAVSYGTSGGGVFDAESGELLGIVRGYRTAKLSFPGSDSGSLDLPIAGETTVVPAGALLCLLSRAGLSSALGAHGPAPARCEADAAPLPEVKAPGEERVETSHEVPTRR